MPRLANFGEFSSALETPRFGVYEIGVLDRNTKVFVNLWLLSYDSGQFSVVIEIIHSKDCDHSHSKDIIMAASYVSNKAYILWTEIQDIIRKVSLWPTGMK